ncbi:MAG: hypothetical protein KME43_26390 [Myxacorys chilensis ATA2-1-KO14]|nr:hypothetical protein [Myxacorys chilensis ATA2-1-KO14]
MHHSDPQDVPNRVAPLKLSRADHEKQHCHCGECFDPNLEDFPRTFRCTSCSQEVPWCRGMDDNYAELCDQCAINVMSLEGLLDS